jgi:hypothetical protein
VEKNGLIALNADNIYHQNQVIMGLIFVEIVSLVEQE